MGRGLLAPLERLNVSPDQFNFASAQSAGPPATKADSLSMLRGQPWDSSWHKSPWFGPDRLQLAAMDNSIPWDRAARPPFPFPGTPEWTDQFIRGLQGLINAFRRSGRGGGIGRRDRDDNKDECLRRLGEEMRRCEDRIDEYAHRDFLSACKERAKYRWGLCIQNKGQPHPDEPAEWGPKDEEIWRNFGR
jgi:hypothetical protein